MSVKTRRALRTVIQAAVSGAVVLPVVVASPGVAEALPWLVGAAAGAGALARIMAMPAVERLLDLVGLGLVDESAGGGR